MAQTDRPRLGLRFRVRPRSFEIRLRQRDRPRKRGKIYKIWQTKIWPRGRDRYRLWPRGKKQVLAKRQFAV